MLIYGDRVRSARLLRGISGSVVANTLRWSQATQTRLESALSQDVTPEQAQALSTLLSVTPAFLGASPPPALPPTELLFRAPARTTKREKSYLAEYARLVGELLDWLDERHRLPPVKLPTFSAATDLSSAAAETRNQLGIDPNDPIPHLTHRVERAGVTIVVRDAVRSVNGLHSVPAENQEDVATSALREDHHAYSTRVGELRERPLVVAKAHPSWERTRLTIAHEIGHLVLHSRELPTTAEEQAFEFAAELLAPTAALKAVLPNPVTLAALVPVKLHFGLSLGALIKHLARTELISTSRHSTLESQLYRRRNPGTGTTWGRQEPGWDQQQPERPMLLKAWLERCAGTAETGAIIAGALPHMPKDILTSILSGQRGIATSSRKAPRLAAYTSAGDAAIVDLAARRTR